MTTFIGDMGRRYLGDYHRIILQGTITRVLNQNKFYLQVFDDEFGIYTKNVTMTKGLKVRVEGVLAAGLGIRAELIEVKT